MDLMTIGFVVAAAVAVVEAIMLLKRPAASEAAPAAPAAPAPAAPAAPAAPSQELVAAVSAALAEELGTDITRIRIKSITKL
jgi:hypothetical protein